MKGEFEMRKTSLELSNSFIFIYLETLNQLKIIHKQYTHHTNQRNKKPENENEWILLVDVIVLILVMCVMFSGFLGSGVTLVFQEKSHIYCQTKKTVNFSLFVIQMGFVTLITLRFWHNIELLDESLNQLDVFPLKLIKMWN